MFQYFKDCTIELASSPSWVTLTLQIITLVIASCALYVAWNNLGGVKRAQNIQAQMNLINLENEMRKNRINYKMLVDEYAKLKNTDRTKELNAFELYLSSADKLAALINSEYVQKQFPKRVWKDEYLDLFRWVRTYYEGEDTIIQGKDKMIQNVLQILKSWEQK